MPSPEEILAQIAGIERMERGKICRLRDGPRGPYHNHQTWEAGRNVVRYVPRERLAELQSAIDGYNRFKRLVDAYADAIIRRTRARSPPPAGRPRGPAAPGAF